MAYLVRRVTTAIPMLIVVSLVTFLLMHAAPGGPFDRSRGRHLDPATLSRLERAYGLDRPIWEQYLVYMRNTVRLDFGFSSVYQNRKVTDLLGEHFPFSARLGLQSMLFALVIGLPLGVIAGLRHNSWVDYTALSLTTVGIAVPSFVLSLGLIILFGSTLHVVSVAPTLEEYRTQLKPWILPTVALALPVASLIARHIRSSVIEVLYQDYIRTARGKGVSEPRLVLDHVLRNALLPVWTLSGPLVAGLITGSVIVERLFMLPGIGAFFIEAIGGRDYSMIMGTTLFYAIVVISLNLFIDLTYVFFDPRIRIEG